MSVLAPPKPQSPPPRRGSAPGRPRGLVIQPDEFRCYAQSITAKLMTQMRTQVTHWAALLGLRPKRHATLNNPFVRLSRERYIARLLDDDPGMAETFLGVVQTVWPLLDNSTRAKVLMLTRTDKVHAWIRIHHPETQP